MRFGGLQHQLQQHQQQQQQQAQQLQSLFFQNPEGTSSPGAACFWRSFRPSVAWCFGVAKGAFWRLAAPPLVAAPAAAAAGPAGPAGPAAELALFLLESRRDVKPRGSMFLEVVPSFSSMLFRCGEECVLEICSTISTGHNTCVFYFVSAPCHGTAQHLATKRKINGKVYLLNKMNNFTSSRPTFWLKSSRNCSGG